jgi:hypothetical protein
MRRPKMLAGLTQVSFGKINLDDRLDQYLTTSTLTCVKGCFQFALDLACRKPAPLTSRTQRQRNVTLIIQNELA